MTKPKVDLCALVEKSADADLLREVLSPVLVRRADATPGAGELRMVAGTPNPAGRAERVFLLKGDPLAGPIRAIIAEDGALVPERRLADGERHVLRLMHFNDMHNHMTDMHPKRGNTHRMAQMVKRVNKARAAAADNETVLLLSGGDDHTGSIFDELLGWNGEEYVVDAGYRAASAAGVDIAVLGNHEFDRGAAQLKLGIERDAAFPVLSANVADSAHLTRDLDYVPAAIIEANQLRVGVIGLTTNIDIRTGTKDDPGMRVACPVEAATNLYKAVEAVSDVVVILSHCGYGKGMHQSGKAGALREIGEGDFSIAEAIGSLASKPVVIVGGHSHTELNTDGINPDNLVSGVLLTQAKANGAFLGEIAMSIAAGGGRDTWFSSVSLHPVKKRDDTVPEGVDGYDALEQDGDYDAAFETEIVEPMIAALDDKLAEVIGNVAEDAPVSTEQTLATRYTTETALANFINDTLVRQSETFPGGAVDFALFSATGLAKGIEPGEPLSYRAWFDVMPYADQVEIATMTGAEIRDMLDSNAKRLLRPEEVEETDTSAFVSRGLLHFSSGIRYKVALGDSVADARAVEITLAGKPVEEVLDRTFRFAFNTYVMLGAFSEAWNGKLISGGVADEIPSPDLRALSYENTGLVYRNELISAIRKMGTVTRVEGADLDGRLVIVA
ncbi:bifunctional metallophosphatase/5'-nucleotidase [Roseibium aggregatum]|uniref:Trifunctional nucleotide phosphoesterase protein YfkN n=1 Tax=Roseibium aggregatum TaxID=187304 RepID=A0A0M6YCM9_9HYPH|nr:5'-nucleotidase C-terminal domain-containing protein [Roseibium aggregatum]CTQ47464.1 Trifunctional nucleotide phosphoesterase protein YfkN precursor [Roseibium aggregatum]